MYIGIDLGTSSVKVLMMATDGTIIDEKTCDYPVSYPKKNWAEQDPNDWWAGTINALKQLINSNEDKRNLIKGIGFSGQMHGMVALDQIGNVITPAILWCDQRTQEECDDITLNFGKEKLSRVV